MKAPMLSRPKKPPSNTLLPPESLRLTHLHRDNQINKTSSILWPTNHVKFNKSFWKTLSKNCTSSFPNSFLSILNTRNVAQACTGGLTSLKFHSYAGIWPSGFIYHSRTSNFSCCFANAGSTIANGMQWNAVSHAAKNGYSHLSGMERISAICRWRQS